MAHGVDVAGDPPEQERDADLVLVEETRSQVVETLAA